MINANLHPVYAFFSTQISKAESEIRQNKFALCSLAKKQTELKRGKAYLVKLRQEYAEKVEPKIKKKKTGVALHTTNAV